VNKFFGNILLGWILEILDFFHGKFPFKKLWDSPWSHEKLMSLFENEKYFICEKAQKIKYFSLIFK